MDVLRDPECTFPTLNRYPKPISGKKTKTKNGTTIYQVVQLQSLEVIITILSLATSNQKAEIVSPIPIHLSNQYTLLHPHYHHDQGQHHLKLGTISRLLTRHSTSTLVPFFPIV